MSIGREERLVMTEGEIEGKCLLGRRRRAWTDYVRRWTEGGLPAARRIALDRLCQIEIQHNSVVRCARRYKGYGLLGETGGVVYVSAFVCSFVTTNITSSCRFNKSMCDIVLEKL